MQIRDIDSIPMYDLSAVPGSRRRGRVVSYGLKQDNDGVLRMFFVLAKDGVESGVLLEPGTLKIPDGLHSGQYVVFKNDGGKVTYENN